MASDASWRRAVGRSARAAYEREYTAERAYARLMEIYAAAGSRRVS